MLLLYRTSVPEIRVDCPNLYNYFGPKNGPNLRTRRDSVSADREIDLFGPKGAKLPWFWGPSALENGPKFLSDCRQRP